MNLLDFKHHKKFATFLAGLFVVILVLGIIWLNFQNPIKMEKLRSDFSSLIQYESLHPFLFTLLLSGVYIVSILFVIPDSTLISLLSGTIYPLPFAVIFISLCETIGAVAYFLVIKFALKIYYKKRTISLTPNKFKKNFDNNKIFYLLGLRFCHLFPFWMINVFAASMRIPLWTFIWTTFVGTLPLSWVLAQAGKGFKIAMEQHTHFSTHDFLNKQTEIALLGLGIITLLPIVVRHFIKKL
ncbi:MAG: VTT domain-containing protein [Chlamydiae bacterium]|nr:VTT domain-containing protein [Chlamydiota bacterium]